MENFTNPQAVLIYQDLKSRYLGATVNKKQIAMELGVSVSTVDLYISKNMGIPNYKKLGTAKNAKVVFTIIDLAEFLSNTIKTA
ncbi:hypothetical protein [Candidatus Sulfurimonas marisnigri]|uniref:hypothetical protein n=1 Tax=Candidatus Sulfurimonas marisnigri TaxID=2740405 RepID=UPI001E494DE4|nr:hypothetical protein [Candidatus Sulfurimonas marisnigri]